MKTHNHDIMRVIPPQQSNLATEIATGKVTLWPNDNVQTFCACWLTTESRESQTE